MTVADDMARTDRLPSSVCESKTMIGRNELQVHSALQQQQQQLSQLLDNGQNVLDELSAMIDDLGSGSLFR